MKKLVCVIISLALIFSLAACGESAPEEVNMVDVIMGDVTMTLPDFLSDVEEQNGVYVAAGQECSVAVTQLQEAVFLPEDWTEDTAAELVDYWAGSTYSDIEVAALQSPVELNGSSAVYVAFYGTNAKGVSRLVQMVFIYTADATQMCQVSLVHTEGDEVFTQELSEEIVNSITLG